MRNIKVHQTSLQTEV